MIDYDLSMESIEHLAKDFFPFQTPNPGQMEAIVFALSEFLLHNKKHVILELPTAVGKSAISYTVHKVIEQYDKNHRSTIATATKGLQDQYVNSFPDIYDLKGKSNYSCPIGNDSYGTPQCKKACGGGTCKPNEYCPYVKRRNIWLKSSDFRITNNAFFCKAPTGLIGAFGDGDKPSTRANLTIFDECHELETSVIDAAAIDADLTDLMSNIQHRNQYYGEPIGEIVNTIYETFQTKPFKVNDTVAEFVKELLIKPKEYVKELSDKVSAGDEAYTVELDTVSDMVESISRLIGSPEEEWIITSYTKLKNIVIKPVYASGVAETILYAKSDRFLHMSATICGAKQYVKTLGIPTDNYAYMSCDNPIPIKSRTVGIIKGLSLSKSFTKWDVYYKLIEKLLTKHSDVRGIIHTVSFDLANKIKDNMPTHIQSRCLVSGDMNEIYSYMEETPTGIIISPSIVKGYDFKQDLSRFQIIAKMPFPYLGDPHVKLNCDRDGKWYSRQTVVSLIQMCGRSIRGVDDWSHTYVVDENVVRLLGKDRDLFPSWFLESVTFLN